MDEFLQTSVILTGFSRFDLLATGLAKEYLDLLIRAVGGAIMNELNVAVAAQPFEQAVRENILGDSKLGPVAKNLIKLWYLGYWAGMPEEWTQSFGVRVQVVPAGVVSAEAYKEGLAWRAIKAHPVGAKQPGFGTWSRAPEPE